MPEQIIRTERDRHQAIQQLAAMPLARPIRLTMTNVKSKRSLAQNRLLWMWNNCIQEHLREHFGQIASAEEWHEILTAKLWPAEIRTVELPGGWRFKVGRAKTRNFSTLEMTHYLERLDAYCAEHLGLILPHPEELTAEAMGAAA